jgi:hypothetical protein
VDMEFWLYGNRRGLACTRLYLILNSQEKG